MRRRSGRRRAMYCLRPTLKSTVPGEAELAHARVRRSPAPSSSRPPRAERWRRCCGRAGRSRRASRTGATRCRPRGSAAACTVTPPSRPARQSRAASPPEKRQVARPVLGEQAELRDDERDSCRSRRRRRRAARAPPRCKLPEPPADALHRERDLLAVERTQPERRCDRSAGRRHRDEQVGGQEHAVAERLVLAELAGRARQPGADRHDVDDQRLPAISQCRIRLIVRVRTVPGYRRPARRVRRSRACSRRSACSPPRARSRSAVLGGAVLAEHERGAERQPEVLVECPRRLRTVVERLDDEGQRRVLADVDVDRRPLEREHLAAWCPGRARCGAPRPSGVAAPAGRAGRRKGTTRSPSTNSAVGSVVLRVAVEPLDERPSRRSASRRRRPSATENSPSLDAGVARQPGLDAVAQPLAVRSRREPRATG